MRTILHLLIFLTAVSAAFGQSHSKHRSPERTEKVNGWEVPVVDSLEVLRSSVIKVREYDIDETQFELRELKPTIPIEIGNGLHCEFITLFSYTLNDRRFAVGGECVILSFRGQFRDYSAAVTEYLFLDEDTDGVYEARYNLSPAHKNRLSLIEDSVSRWELK
ncbi:MAG: hypothetical protein IPM21_05705 [Acidobacteria bacterium]|nr:hypothetical protein [Acidobacteriota bacterium]